MKHWEVRTNCEYVFEVDADTEEEALTQAGKVDVATWAQAWAPMEIEEVVRLESYWDYEDHLVQIIRDNIVEGGER